MNYYKALRDLKEAGHACPGFDPLKSSDTCSILNEGKSFIIYDDTSNALYLEFIHVDKSDRGKGVGKRMLRDLESIVKAGLTKATNIRLNILLGNDASLGLFKDYTDRSIEKEKIIC